MEEQVIKLDKVEVDRIVFYNPQTKWGIFRVRNDERIQLLDGPPLPDIAVAGNFEGVYVGCKVTVDGNIIQHPKYGRQVQIKNIVVIHDNTTQEGVINFLTKSVIKGIHVQNAKKIYKKFGQSSIDVVLDTPDRLSEISGIGPTTVQKVKESIEQYKKMRDLIQFSIDNGIPYPQIFKLHEMFGAKSIELLKTQPYSLLEYPDVFSFAQVDRIALRIGFAATDPERLKYGLLYTLYNLATLAGSTGVPNNKLIKGFHNLLGVTDLHTYQETLNNLINTKQIIAESGVIYNKKYYDTEKEIADRTRVIASKPLIKGVFKKQIIEEEIKSFPFELTQEQITTIKKCLIHDFSVITGSAGVGKSSIMKALVNIYTRHKFNVELLSPTGKATKRLSECTGRPAQTIHRFLNVKNNIEDAERVVIPENTVIIIDEASMLDIQLFAKLLESVNDTTKLILVGDNNQLPSVQAGNILGDLIDSDVVNVCRLTTVMRQKQDSTILDYCTRVNNGSPIIECDNKDLVYKQFDNVETMHKAIISAYTQEAKKRGSFRDLQVLTIYKKGLLGDTALNKELREAINVVDDNETLFDFALNDKVMHVKNNYKKNVFNGEVGSVVALNDDELLVDYSDKVVTYVTEDIDELQLAYSSTIHKAQGSEYPVTFVVVSGDTSTFLLIRKILYTALSRGKEKVYLFGLRGDVQKCIDNNYYEERYTKLKKFLKED